MAGHFTDDVRVAAHRLAGVAHRTPVLTSRILNMRVGAEVFLECENFQRIGAFKFRAYNAISRLSAEQLARGVVAWSSGNHAQAVALSARLLGTSAVIVMPEDAPASKTAAAKEYGAEIIAYDRYTEDRTAIGRALATERGLTAIPPFDHPQVMAGQGTTALELIERTGPRNAFLAPIGGGGLMAGCATVATALAPGIRIIGVEPVDGDDTKRSLEAGHRVPIPVPHTIADAQAAEIPGELTFAVNRRLVDEIALVTDDQLVTAMSFLFETMKIVAEPTGAAGVAALLAGQVELPGPRVGVVVSGGNISASRFSDLLGNRGTQGLSE
ncbi:pyridoxal-phosphate dependent enzyme [Nocardia sp. CDC159]|uniref:threonine ammonia-lyase n=1 Tax=Nocardia pulmonis TaxID=2951408 RepID=A0A9X2IXZ3_9NOCA|nr:MULTISPECIES: pyridoxal-phosphate dependent enzyme [Nocardia]MCM6774400.1 pyridoxal-phosphate dependent enzyme [Nocardia pulmonis]MCM6787534.1 pyridoxal-phosphate dependent enzyme [Nocardia sp. CDC159]